MDQFLSDLHNMLSAGLTAEQVEQVDYWVNLIPRSHRPFRCNVALPSGTQWTIQMDSMDDCIQMMSVSVWQMKMEMENYVTDDYRAV